MTEENCPHGVNPAWCAICRNSGNVFISAAGLVIDRNGH